MEDPGESGLRFDQENVETAVCKGKCAFISIVSITIGICGVPQELTLNGNVVIVCNHAAAVFHPRNQVPNTFDICGRENTIRLLDGVLLRCTTATATVVPIELL